MMKSTLYFGSKVWNEHDLEVWLSVSGDYPDMPHDTSRLIPLGSMNKAVFIFLLIFFFCNFGDTQLHSQADFTVRNVSQ